MAKSKKSKKNIVVFRAPTHRRMELPCDTLSATIIPFTIPQPSTTERRYSVLFEALVEAFEGDREIAQALWDKL